ncbi:MAG: FMN-binding protein, partial [Methylococcales bacterium]
MAINSSRLLPILRTGLLIILVAATSQVAAITYQTSVEFLKQEFGETTPAPRALWIKRDLSIQLQSILQHKPGFMRARYWKRADKTVWILDEIGKTELITFAVLIENNTISKISVLEFRETRGWEIIHDFFTRQFLKARLNSDLSLSQSVDNITGATLSVRAMQKIARVALLLDQT